MSDAYDDLVLGTEEKMEKSIVVLREEYRGMRSGRANSGLVEHIRVDYYGVPTPLKQMATIGVPEANQILIKPFDPSMLKEIERAISASDLGITPSNDGKQVRLVLPPLSEERRRTLVNRAKELAEESRIAIRNVRRDANKHADGLKEDGDITEDDLDRLKEDIQEATKRYAEQVDKLLQNKTEELMSV